MRESWDVYFVEVFLADKKNEITVGKTSVNKVLGSAQNTVNRLPIQAGYS